MNSNENIWTVKMIAALLRVAPGTVRTWITTHALRATRKRGRYEVQHGELLAFLCKHQTC